MIFTLIETSGFYEGGSRNEFQIVRRIWLGGIHGGADWLHDALRAEFSAVTYEVESERRSISAGFSAETITVALVLLGGGAVEFARAFGKRAGEESADAVIEWVRERGRERRGERNDPPPDFARYEVDRLTTGMRAELAGLLGKPDAALELVSASRTDDTPLVAIYRDRETGVEYEALVQSDSAVFTRR
jgi:hypothetical protein